MMAEGVKYVLRAGPPHVAPTPLIRSALERARLLRDPVR